MMDVSDGLVLDASRLAAASGVTVDIDESALGADAIDALTGGEDHALLATFPAGSTPPDGFRVIGRVVQRRRTRCSSTVDHTRAGRAGTPIETGMRTAADQSEGRTHHSTVSPYFLSRE